MTVLSTPQMHEPRIASSLTGRSGERLVLHDVSVRAVLHDLLAEVTIEQTYRNTEPINIEAVYTFPLPLDAVLLELDVEIGERRLEGTVVEKKAAERQYEDALCEGDSAVMLEVAEPGLYTMNVGNLLPNETATIRFSYALLHRWSGDTLRLHLPTTIAPRYGTYALRAHQVPAASLTVENRFSLQMEVYGELREAKFTCPTHVVTMTATPEKTVISLSQNHAVMDRDFVLNVMASRFARSFAVCGRDGQGHAAIASFQPYFPDKPKPRALDLAIVIDCSGSMAGASMQQAKQALQEILKKTQPHDRLSFIAFGSSTRALWHRSMKCSPANIERAIDFAAELDANMGGTEVGRALREAYRMLGNEARGDLLLITDGQVAAWPTVVEEARRAGHRVFTVGVGSAVSEAFMHELASATGGQTELVSPREGMAGRIVRHFERMRAPRATRVSLLWPANASDTTPTQIGAVFEGDSVVATARFDAPPHAAEVVLEVESESGTRTRHALSLVANADAGHTSDISTVARVAAAMRMDTQDGDKHRATALRYRLVSPWTNWLVMAPRVDAAKSRDLPQLRTVPQTLAAGWGGTGDLALNCFSARIEERSRLEERRAEMCYERSGSRARDLEARELARVRAEHERQAQRAIIPPSCVEVRLKLVEKINTDPATLQAHRATTLLLQTHAIYHFGSLTRLAGQLSADLDGIAAVLIDRWLEGVPESSLSEDARAAYALFGEHAKRSYNAITDPRLREALDEALDKLTHALAEDFNPDRGRS